MYRIAPNGKASAAVEVSTGSGDGFDPAVAVAPDGTGAVVYAERPADSAVSVVKLRRFDSTGKLAATVVSLSDASRSAARPAVALAPDGTATVAWEYSAAPYGAAAARITPAGALLRSYQLCAEQAGLVLEACGGVKVVTAGTGASTIVWREQVAPTAAPFGHIRMLWISPADIAAEPDSLSAGSDAAGDPQLVLGSDDSALAEWQAGPSPDACPTPPAACPNNRIEARTISKTGTKDTTRTFVTETSSTFSTYPRSPVSLAADGSGGYLLAWVDSPGKTGAAGSEVRFRRVSKSGTAGAVRTPVADAASLGAPGITAVVAAFSADGSAQLIWRTDESVLQQSTVPKSDLPSRAKPVPGSAGTSLSAPLLAKASDGTATVVWLSAGTSATNRLLTQVLTAPPSVSNISFSGKVSKGDKSTQLSFKSTKYGSATIELVATSAKTKFATRKTVVRKVVSGTNLVTVDTKGIVRGTFQVTVKVTDLVGGTDGASAKLIVLH